MREAVRFVPITLAERHAAIVEALDWLATVQGPDQIPPVPEVGRRGKADEWLRPGLDGFLRRPGDGTVGAFRRHYLRSLAAIGCLQLRSGESKSTDRMRIQFAIAFHDADNALDLLTFTFLYISRLVAGIAEQGHDTWNWLHLQIRSASETAAEHFRPWTGDHSRDSVQLFSVLGDRVLNPPTPESEAELRQAISGLGFVTGEAVYWWSMKVHQYLGRVGPGDIISRDVERPWFWSLSAKTASEVPDLLSGYDIGEAVRVDPWIDLLQAEADTTAPAKQELPPRSILTLTSETPLQETAERSGLLDAHFDCLEAACALWAHRALGHSFGRLDGIISAMDSATPTAHQWFAYTATVSLGLAFHSKPPAIESTFTAFRKAATALRRRGGPIRFYSSLADALEGLPRGKMPTTEALLSHFMPLPPDARRCVSAAAAAVDAFLKSVPSGKDRDEAVRSTLARYVARSAEVESLVQPLDAAQT